MTYDGIEKWNPPEIMDIEILKAFHQHQRTDKGFGSALGPSAVGRMQSLLQGREFKVVCAHSPWVMNHRDQDLIEQLAIGSARAVREIGTLPMLMVEEWEKNRGQANNCEIGHIDLFAYKFKTPTKIDSPSIFTNQTSPNFTKRNPYLQNW